MKFVWWLCFIICVSLNKCFMVTWKCADLYFPTTHLMNRACQCDTSVWVIVGEPVSMLLLCIGATWRVHFHLGKQKLCQPGQVRVLQWWTTGCRERRLTWQLPEVSQHSFYQKVRVSAPQAEEHVTLGTLTPIVLSEPTHSASTHEESPPSPHAPSRRSYLYDFGGDYIEPHWFHGDLLWP